jgi:hypothetical protein
VPKTGANLSYALSAPRPAGTTHLLAFSANGGSEGPSASVATSDLAARYTDISDASQRTPMVQPRLSALIDTVAQRLLVLGGSQPNNRALELNRCDLSMAATSAPPCAFSLLDASPSSGFEPSALYDAKNNKLLVASEGGTGAQFGLPLLNACNLDGTGCSEKTLTATGSPAAHGGVDPSAVIDAVTDPANPALIIVAGDYSTLVGKLAIYRCKLDGTACTFNEPNLVAATPADDISPAAVVDTVDHKLVIATHDNALSGHLGLTTCNLDGTGCAHQDLSASALLGNDSGSFPAIAYDAASATLFVASQNTANQEHVALFRCAYQVAGSFTCSYSDPSSGQPLGAGFTPSLAMGGGKLLIVTQNGTNNLRPALYRCPLATAGACDYGDISGGAPSDAGYFPSAVVDPAGARLWVAAEYFDQVNYRPVLFDVPLY